MSPHSAEAKGTGNENWCLNCEGKKIPEGCWLQALESSGCVVAWYHTEVTPVPGIVLLKNNRKYIAEKLQPIQHVWVRLQPGSLGWGTPNPLGSLSHPHLNPSKVRSERRGTAGSRIPAQGPRSAVFICEAFRAFQRKGQRSLSLNSQLCTSSTFTAPCRWVCTTTMEN